MDPVSNPFSPGAGIPPPVLAGRDDMRETVRVVLERLRRGLQTKSIMMIGLRGVGKTVLLDQMRDDAEATGIQAVCFEAPDTRSLPAIFAPQLRHLLLRLSRNEQAKTHAQNALKGLSSFARALKDKFKDIEVGYDFEPELGPTYNGDLEHDLEMLLEASGTAAQKAGTVLAMFVDEMQFVESDELAALVVALHRISHKKLPVVLVGAGLPQLRERMNQATQIADRLFDYPEIKPLTRLDLDLAIGKPALDQKVKVNKDALDLIFERTSGFPYFVQEWAKHAWEEAEKSPITRENVEASAEIVIAALDKNYFQLRFYRLTPAEKKYLRATAALGAGPHRSGDIARELGREVTALSPTRNKLIAKGMIWSPSHGDTAFTVPQFDQFMRRIMPGDDWLQDELKAATT
ncbi:MAG: AAA family ATPase [Planctomycetes bacterium]|nr:AAA family ATPase [Planctomycetota bacterium]